MPQYRRAFVPGGTHFFTLVTEHRAKILCEENARTLLRNGIDTCRTAYPFDPVAMVLLPDHLHAIWTLPRNDTAYPRRWSMIKSHFTREWIRAGGAEQSTTESRARHRRRGVWQRKYWEHWIRDEEDYRRHMDYIHYNPVKHGLARCPHEWKWSTFAKWVERKCYAPDWMCSCDGRKVTPPDFSGMEGLEME